MLLHACVEIESDIFWISITSEGYRSFILAKSREIKSLIHQDQPLPIEEEKIGGEIVKFLKKAVVALTVKARKKRKVIESDDEDDE